MGIMVERVTVTDSIQILGSSDVNIPLEMIIDNKSEVIFDLVSNMENYSIEIILNASGTIAQNDNLINGNDLNNTITNCKFTLYELHDDSTNGSLVTIEYSENKSKNKYLEEIKYRTEISSFNLTNYTGKLTNLRKL